VGNISQRPVTDTDPANVRLSYTGSFRYNSEDSIIEYFDGTSWVKTQGNDSTVLSVTISGSDVNAITGN
jgi:hypothetical protein